MRIYQSNRSDRMTRAPRSGAARASNASFGVDRGAGAGATSAASGVKPVAALDSLLTIQQIPDAMTGRKRAMKRGADMLDILDDIKLSVLTGAVSRAKLGALLDVVERERDRAGDSGLEDVLDEIELRARVELAKFGKAA